jgi:hemolysin III
MRIREPFNGASHLLGLLLAGAGTILLLRLARGSAELMAFSIYGATLILLYGASTLYHTLQLPERPLRALRTLDHIAIYFLIAGTYTPVALITLNGTLGWTLLAAVWLIALAGIPFKLLFLDAPVSMSGLAWLIAGGMAYTVGAVIYARRRPDPFPGRFGHHEIWHLLVLAGSGCHYAFMVYHVA